MHASTIAADRQEGFELPPVDPVENHPLIGVMRPIRLLSREVNQRLPSGPAAIPYGLSTSPAGGVKTSKVVLEVEAVLETEPIWSALRFKPATSKEWPPHGSLP